MSAFEDIRKALAGEPALPPGWRRVVHVGPSARRSLEATNQLVKVPDNPGQRIDGVPVEPTEEFNGWAVRWIDPSGRVHEAGAGIRVA